MTTATQPSTTLRSYALHSAAAHNQRINLTITLVTVAACAATVANPGMPYVFVLLCTAIGTGALCYGWLTISDLHTAYRDSTRPQVSVPPSPIVRRMNAAQAAITRYNHQPNTEERVAAEWEAWADAATSPEGNG